VEKDSPAATAGIEPGDLIVSYDGEMISGIDGLQRTLNGERIGRPAQIVVLRHVRKQTLQVTPVEKAAPVEKTSPLEKTSK
jgi:serine protease Do